MQKISMIAVISAAFISSIGDIRAAVPPVVNACNSEIKDHCVASGAGRNGRSENITKDAEPGVLGQAEGRNDVVNDKNYGAIIVDESVKALGTAYQKAKSIITDSSVQPDEERSSPSTLGGRADIADSSLSAPAYALSSSNASGDPVAETSASPENEPVIAANPVQAFADMVRSVSSGAPAMYQGRDNNLQKRTAPVSRGTQKCTHDVGC